MNSQKREKAIEAWLERPRGDSRSGQADVCPDEETIAAWVEGALAGEALERVLAHASTCERCETTVAALIRTESVRPSPESIPSATPPFWRRWMAWGVPLAAAATAVVVLAVWVRTPTPPSFSDAGAPAAASAPDAAPTQATAGSNAAVPGGPDGVDAAREAEPPLASASTARLDAAKEVSRPNADAGRGREQSGDVRGAPNAEPALAPSATARVEAPAAPPAPSAPSAAAPASAPATQRSAGFAASSAPAAIGAAEVQSSAANGLSWTFVSSPGGMPVWRYRDRVVEYSSDGGSSWSAVGGAVPANILSGSAVSANVCWFVGEKGTVGLVASGRWTLLSFPDSVDLRSVTASSSTTASVTTITGRVFSTADGGRTWRAE